MNAGRRLLLGYGGMFWVLPGGSLPCGRQVRATGLFWGLKMVSGPVEIAVTSADYFCDRPEIGSLKMSIE